MDTMRIDYLILSNCIGNKRGKLSKWQLILCNLAIYLIQVTKHHCKLILLIFKSNNAS
jgi:hypothetical protein